LGGFGLLTCTLRCHFRPSRHRTAFVCAINKARLGRKPPGYGCKTVTAHGPTITIPASRLPSAAQVDVSTMNFFVSSPVKLIVSEEFFGLTGQLAHPKTRPRLLQTRSAAIWRAGQETATALGNSRVANGMCGPASRARWHTSWQRQRRFRSTYTSHPWSLPPRSVRASLTLLFTTTSTLHTTSPPSLS